MRYTMIRIDEDLLILIQDKGISATHPIILKRKEDQIIVCSVSDKKRYNYSIILPSTRIKNWDTKDKDYFLHKINDTNYFIDSSAGHDLSKENGILEDLIEEVHKYIK